VKKAKPMPKKKQSSRAVNQALERISAEEHRRRQTWEELEDLYQTTAQNMLATMASVEAVISTPNIIDYVKDKDTYNAAIRTLTNDFNALGDKLVSIHNKHEGKTGPVATEFELSQCFGIYGEYSVFFEQFKGLTLPTIMSITDMAMEAKAAYDATKQTEASAQLN